ncbi:MAG: 2-dehydropantoate 2-reductase [Candidatus Bathyarchaeia archaeon]
MRIAVIGAGAIGSLFGGLLAKNGNDVTLIGRKDHVEAIRRLGLRIEGIQHCTVRDLWAVSDIDEVERRKYDLLLLTVKAYSTVQALSVARGLIKGGTPLLCLQNGLGVEELAMKLVQREDLMRGVTGCAAILDRPGVIIHTGMGETVIGELSGKITPRAQIVAEAFNSSGLTTKVTHNISDAVWMKTLVNAGINPFAALTGMKNGELIKVDGLRGLMVETVEEGRKVAERLGVELSGDPVLQMLTVAELTSENINSMLIDVERGRPTEIDFINGAISHVGGQVGVPTPLNRILTQLVKAKASKVSERIVERR